MNNIAEQNKQTVEKFFSSIEDQNFDFFQELFTTDARGFQPFAPNGFPNNLIGAEGFYKEFSEVAARFGFKSIKFFPRLILTTEDPNFIFAQFSGNVDLAQGGKYQNQYLATFKFIDGKIFEYTEYFNPIILSKTFGIPL
ncbi:Ketosteroid isomerase-related protein [Chitinophaga costaii]|uniref:Ketosteroid isomerase-related protein n=1 Tax=Chitinophaga costaii TaxID=1335309 RepID=A0A1C4EYC0_9BACT|nr:nuclear transport factor 2 family protein [Chitinophaga costaii]PUZ21550.1 hypothetical protein DCM91_16055 [Chitinophaga costaii]SCC48647.1 Ketosteroid isomerase-related protein [Chitinophaga costaii]